MDFQTQIETQEPRNSLLIQYELERNKPIPSLNHARAQSRLTFQLGLAYDVEFDILPELTIDFPVKTAVPDIAIYPKMANDWDADIIKRTDLPLLVVEILSSNQVFNDLCYAIDHRLDILDWFTQIFLRNRLNRVTHFLYKNYEKKNQCKSV